MRMLSSRSRRRGFTLLEVVVSVGILAVALMAIADLNGGAVRMHVYAKQLTIATQLARGKLLDIEQQLRKDGLSDWSKEYKGDFEKEGQPEIKWKALVVKPDIALTPDQIMTVIVQALQLKVPEQPGAPKDANPLAALGPMGGMVDGLAKQLVETIKTSVREVKLTVFWKSGNATEETTFVEHLVVLPDAMRAAAAAQTPMAAGGSGGGAGGTQGGVLGAIQAAGTFPGANGIQGTGAFAPAAGIPSMTQMPGGGLK